MILLSLHNDNMSKESHKSSSVQVISFVNYALNQGLHLVLMTYLNCCMFSGMCMKLGTENLIR